MSPLVFFFPRRKQPTMPAPSVPPTPPPKDFSHPLPRLPQHAPVLAQLPRHVAKPLPVPQLDHLADVSMSSVSDLHYPPTTSPSPPPPPVPSKVILHGRVDLSPRLRLTPEERLQQRRAVQHRREREEQDALREERERQARQRHEKEDAERRAREDDERRRAQLEDQLRHAAARKAREEREAKMADERRSREIRERKRLAHERRLDYTRELQKWRHDQIRRAESQSSEKDEERRRATERRRSRIAHMSDTVLHDDDAFNGWVTIQTPDSFSWKRRFFMFDLAHSQLSLCRNQRDSTRSVELVSLDGQIQSFNEWYEGHEELEAIPHSFAITFIDGRTWLAYADSEEDKDRLLLLLSEAAGVII